VYLRRGARDDPISVTAEHEVRFRTVTSDPRASRCPGLTPILLTHCGKVAAPRSETWPGQHQVAGMAKGTNGALAAMPKPATKKAILIELGSASPG
jgi:hypothetical protein